MSDETSDRSNTPPRAMSGMIRQGHGGSLKPGGNPRVTDPTPADVAALARKRVYQIIPMLTRIARNREVAKRGRKTKKRPYSIANQIRAAAELRLLAQDRSLSESQVVANLLSTSTEIYEFLPRDQAQALMQKIAPHWLKA